MAEAIAVLKQQGAVIVDPADIPSVVTLDSAQNLLKWNTAPAWKMQKARMTAARSYSSTA